MKIFSFIRGFVIFLVSCSLLLATPNQCRRNVHAFFYLWYDIPNDTGFGNGTYKHWNHEVLPHWGGEEVNKLYPSVGTRHEPEKNLLHSPFFPLGGPYSSTDRNTIRRQLQELEETGIEVIVVSWWGQESKSYATDTQGVNTDQSVSVLLQVASEMVEEKGACSIKIAFHLEPYPSRSVESVREDVEYIIDRYSNLSAFYRDKETNKPLFYVYDSYHISSIEWRRLLTPGAKGSISIRGHPQYDGLFIGLWLEGHHGIDLVSGGFDGVYTYFASDGFSYGSTMENWSRICSFCRTAKKLCSLSVGPGYVDTAIRPWNAHNSKERRCIYDYNIYFSWVVLLVVAVSGCCCSSSSSDSTSGSGGSCNSSSGGVLVSSGTSR